MKQIIDCRTQLAGRSIVSIRDLQKQEILTLLQLANDFEKGSCKKNLNNKILALCFHEPSTRTELSFTSAMLRLQGKTLGYSRPETTSAKKGESLSDTIALMDSWCDAFIIRHPKQGAARLAADLSPVPVINAGDGTGEHPTQTLVDLYAMQKTQGRLENLNIALIGDLKHGRAPHSLALAAPNFQHRLYFVSPQSLEMPSEICRYLGESGIRYSMHRSIEEIIDKVDILYMTRMQKERIPSDLDCTNYFSLSNSLLNKAQESARVLHPLPRVNEIDRSCDTNPRAYYFQQARSAIWVRMALLSSILGETP